MGLSKAHLEIISRLSNYKRDVRDANILRMNERITAEEKIYTAYRDGLLDAMAEVEKAGELIAEQGQTACEFCRREDRKAFETERGEISMCIAKCIPFPAVDLTTGNTATKADDPYYIIDADVEGGETDSFKINFCPICGRKLEIKKEE